MLKTQILMRNPTSADNAATGFQVGDFVTNGLTGKVFRMVGTNGVWRASTTYLTQETPIRSISVTLPRALVESSLNQLPIVLVAGEPGKLFVPLSVFMEKMNTGNVGAMSQGFVPFVLKVGESPFSYDGEMPIAEVSGSLVFIAQTPNTTSFPISPGGAMTLRIEDARLSATGIETFLLTEPGRGYKVGDLVYFNSKVSQGSGVDFILQVDSVIGSYACGGGNVNNPNINAVGDIRSQLTIGNTITLTENENGNNGTYTITGWDFLHGVTAIAVAETPPGGNPFGYGKVQLNGLPNSGGIATYTVLSNGSGYVSGETISAENGTGTGAMITVNSIGLGLGDVLLTVLYSAVGYS